MPFTTFFSGLKKLFGFNDRSEARQPPPVDHRPEMGNQSQVTSVASAQLTTPAQTLTPATPRASYPPLTPAARSTHVRPSPPTPTEGDSAPKSTSTPSKPEPVPSRGLRWLGRCTFQFQNAGITFRDPLAYFHNGPLPPGQVEPAAIDLALPLAPPSTAAVDDPPLPYWPQYGQLTVSQRHLYLVWLAGGRREAPTQLGYTFLFIYGLERRALLDRQDVKAVFKEILQLRLVYEQSGCAISHSFESYTSSFLWFVLLREPAIFAERHFTGLAKSMRSWDEDRLAAALSWLARDNRPLPAWLAFELAQHLPRSQRSVVAKRVGNQLRDLFMKRFQDQFPEGMALRSSKRDRKYPYRPASAVLDVYEVMAPNPMGIVSQFKVLSDLWNDCIASLKRLSSVVASGSVGAAVTVEAWRAMPAELRADIDHPMVDSFASFIEAQTGDSQYTIVTARKLATLTGIAADTKLTLAACRRAAETVSDVGYCVEPDPRITGRSLGDDESVILFLNLGDGDASPDRYPAAAALLEVGLFLASVDGETEESELSLLTQQLDSVFELNEHEQRRLSILRALRVASPQPIADVTRPLKKLPVAQVEQVAKFAVALVAADGLVTKNEIKAVRRLYTAMGLDREQADAALDALSAQASSSDDPVTVRAAVAGPEGEAIPTPPSKQSAIPRLNREAIAAILKDTLEVSRMLAQAMNLEERGVEPSPATIPSEVVTPSQVLQPTVEVIADPDMPARYAAFYQIVITRQLWSRADLARLAKQHDLMLSGAVEAINDWATTKHGGPLLYEDDDRFTLESAHLN